MNIKVHYRDINFKKIDDQITVPETTTIKELLDHLGVPMMMAVVNGKVARPEVLLQENDEVFLFNQMVGG